jgi:hypothetical protein
MPSFPSTPDISVIVASAAGERATACSIDAIRVATRGVAAEIIVVEALDDVTPAGGSGLHGDVTVVHMPVGTLTPRLWSEGLFRARGRIVAFTTTQFVVGPRWAMALIEGIRSGWAGVGGNITIAPGASVIDWAVYYLRYSAFMAARPGQPTAGEIAGDNAAYRRDLLDEHRTAFSSGFWEVEYHQLLRRRGERLGVAEGADAAFVGGSSVHSMIGARFAHGAHFARWRIAQAGVSRLRVIFASPLVPVVLLGRIARRALRQRGHRVRFVIASPVLLMFAVAWAFGEFCGGLTLRAAVPMSEVPA